MMASKNSRSTLPSSGGPDDRNHDEADDDSKGGDGVGNEQHVKGITQG